MSYFAEISGFATLGPNTVLVQISKKVGARTWAPEEKGSHSPAKSGLNLNFAPKPFRLHFSLGSFFIG
jgi:hypothetical protein